MITGFISGKTVLAKLYRDLGINSEINELDVWEWISESLNMIGAYSQYNEISDCLELTNGKAKLPCGFFKLVDINYKNNPVYWSTQTNASNYQCSNCQIPICNNQGCKYTFYLNDSYLISNITNDNLIEANNNICIVYLGIPVDSEGYPLIPDDIMYMKAVTSYVTLMLDTQDWRKGKLPDKVYEESKFNWGFYVNSARGAANMPNVQQMENMKNIMVRLMPQHNEYSKGFKNFNKGESLNL